MQDRFKYRHYNNLIKKMTYYCKPEMQVCLNGDFKSGLIFPLSEDIEDNTMYMGNYTYYQQCTGLKDKNGKLIFEGDIVDILSEIDTFAKIEWSEHLARFIIRFENIQCDFDNYNSSELEVVGNIYEDTELLEDV